MTKSDAEDTLLFQIKAVGLPEPEREFRFHPVRKWRFDFAYPDDMIGIEVHGGVFVQGRHSRGVGFTKDAEKHTAAAILGWRILHFTTAHVNSGEAIGWLEAILGDNQCSP